MRNILYICWLSILLLGSCSDKKVHIYNELREEPLQILAKEFKEPPMKYRPYVWWHWMGSNFSKEGIRKDLEAMKEAGIGGATIFNLASAVQESHKPIANNPWPEQTYRSKAYWEAMEYAASEASRLGLKLGLQNTPGYSTTGGPWVTEEKGMQMIVSSKQTVTGGKKVQVQLSRPILPIYEGWGTTHKRASFYKDIAAMAVPDDMVSVEDILDVTDYMKEDGWFDWDAPLGKWTLFRIGYAPTMSNPHPLPDELIGKVLEVDKMSKEQSKYHWRQVLQPLQEHLKNYMGTTFTHILIDSYEAGDQNWTPGFREFFRKQKGYDPLPFIALKLCNEKSDELKKFEIDNRDVINRLYIDNGWKIAKQMIHEAGLQFFWEPYGGPFDTRECVAIPDVPMGEFWTGGNGMIQKDIVEVSKQAGKKIVGAEAFTGRPEISQYTEDPAFLKQSADGSFLSGANLLFLHHWVHQPFDDKYQPGMGMGWWGTHFGRHQTWFKPGKAFFTYLSRCQMLLQQGNLVSVNGRVLHREKSDADIYFMINPTDTLSTQTIISPYKERIPELWDAYHGQIKAVSVSDKYIKNDSLFVSVCLEAGESMFLVLPTRKTFYMKIPAYKIESEEVLSLDNQWDVYFMPKLGKPFPVKEFALKDFSVSSDMRIKYFSGTAMYKKSIQMNLNTSSKNKKVWLDLGELDDIAEVRINGEEAGVLWYPPYRIEITEWIREGENDLEVFVTNNWANCLIGDEQFPADFVWGEDRGKEMGRAIKAFPEWFVKRRSRPSKERKTFFIWSYHRKNSPLQPAGLKGPICICIQNVLEDD